jgi:hypothetical protein
VFGIRRRSDRGPRGRGRIWCARSWGCLLLRRGIETQNQLRVQEITCQQKKRLNPTLDGFLLFLRGHRMQDGRESPAAGLLNVTGFTAGIQKVAKAWKRDGPRSGAIGLCKLRSRVLSRRVSGSNEVQPLGTEAQQ